MPKRAKEQVVHFDLKAAREAVGLSQKETSALLHASQPSISRWEIDGNLPIIYREYWLLYWSVNKPATKKAAAKVAKKKPAKRATPIAEEDDSEPQ